MEPFLVWDVKVFFKYRLVETRVKQQSSAGQANNDGERQVEPIYCLNNAIVFLRFAWTMIKPELFAANKF